MLPDFPGVISYKPVWGQRDKRMLTERAKWA